MREREITKLLLKQNESNEEREKEVMISINN